MAGEFGTLELGEVLWDEFPGEESEKDELCRRATFGGDRGRRPELDAARCPRALDVGDGVLHANTGVAETSRDVMTGEPTADVTELWIERLNDWKLRLGVITGGD